MKLDDIKRLILVFTHGMHSARIRMQFNSCFMQQFYMQITPHDAIPLLEITRNPDKKIFMGVEIAEYGNNKHKVRILFDLNGKERSVEGDDLLTIYESLIPMLANGMNPFYGLVDEQKNDNEINIASVLLENAIVYQKVLDVLNQG